MEVVGLPEGYVARAPNWDDLDAVVDLTNSRSRAVIGVPTTDSNELKMEWSSPGFNLSQDARVVTAPGGRVVGFAGVDASAPYVMHWGWGDVHPDVLGRGIGTALARWVQARGRQHLVKAPEGTRVVVVQDIYEQDRAACVLLEASGYQLVRSYSRMLIEMGAPPPEPILPEGIAIRTFVQETDLKPLVVAARDAFRDHWADVERPFEDELRDTAHWLENGDNTDPSLWFLAVEGDEIAGACLCRPRMPEDRKMVYVDTLGVRRPWRRQGIGLALLLHSFGEIYRCGKRKVALDVDSESLTGATGLYQKAGMRVQRQNLSHELVLRDGVDLSTRTVE